MKSNMKAKGALIAAISMTAVLGLSACGSSESTPTPVETTIPTASPTETTTGTTVEEPDGSTTTTETSEETSTGNVTITGGYDGKGSLIPPTLERASEANTETITYELTIGDYFPAGNPKGWKEANRSEQAAGNPSPIFNIDISNEDIINEIGGAELESILTEIKNPETIPADGSSIYQVTGAGTTTIAYSYQNSDGETVTYKTIVNAS